MAGLHPATSCSIGVARVAGSSPAMTMKGKQQRLLY
jgi:hypothetical protein